MKINRSAPVFIVADGADRAVSLPAALSAAARINRPLYGVYLPYPTGVE